MKILQISIEVNSGSVGRIAEQIGEQVLSKNWESYITYARNNLPSKSKTIRIGSMKDVYWHVFKTRIFDNHCFESKNATKKLVEQIKEIKPDIIHLHHLHGYFINIDILFKYLAHANIPLVWTFHDCWSFTGHCAHFEFVGCEKWKTQCHTCPQKSEYPKSNFKDRSRLNFIQKKELFTSVKNLTIVTPSTWLSNLTKQSFLSNYDVVTINNGIDLNKFTIKNEGVNEVLLKYKIPSKYKILGVAGIWDKKKGFDFFIDLSKKIGTEEVIVLVGLHKDQLKNLPSNIIGIERTENVDELASLYSAADVFLNPTLEDTYPTTNLEAIACGTPVITFRTGGSVESVNENTGIVTESNTIDGVLNALAIVKENGKVFYSKNCRDFAVKNFDKTDCFQKYISLYEKIL